MVNCGRFVFYLVLVVYGRLCSHVLIFHFLCVRGLAPLDVTALMSFQFLFPYMSAKDITSLSLFFLSTLLTTTTTTADTINGDAHPEHDGWPSSITHGHTRDCRTYPLLP